VCGSLMTPRWREPDSNHRSRGKPAPAESYSLLIMTSLSAADSAPQTSPLRPASWRTLAYLSARALETPGAEVEAQERARTPVADPHGIGAMDIHAARLRPRAPHAPHT